MRKQVRPSERFSHIFANASTGVHRQIVEEALIPILDATPVRDAKKAISKARQISERARSAPQLDLAAKKTEVNSLLDELAKDAGARSLSTLSSDSYNILLQEVVESIVDWLNDLWILTYEFGLDFPRAHSCLLFSIGVVDHIQNLNSRGCHCATTSIYVPVTINDSAGLVIKEFTEVGLYNVESGILWVWREVFISLLASKSNKTLVKLLPELLAEVDDILGWRGLERLIAGGESLMTLGQDPSSIYADEDDDNDALYAEHWESRLSRKVPALKRLVRKRMTAIFKISPSYELYYALLILCEDDEYLRIEIEDILSSIATTSASSLATALSIYATIGKADTISRLLKSHRFLLRPRDCYNLQEATRVLVLTTGHRYAALRVIEAELLDTLKCFHHHISRSFSGIDAPQRRAELHTISRLDRDSPRRMETIQQWVDATASPGLALHNPMAFAAMVVGLPFAGDDMEEPPFIDFDQLDPEFSEIREEFRPDIKNRFLGWTSLAATDPDGLIPLQKTYVQACSLMPWLRLSDVTDEMVIRLNNKPSKRHVCDALAAVQNFVDEHRNQKMTVGGVSDANLETQPLLRGDESTGFAETRHPDATYRLLSLSEESTDQEHLGSDPMPMPFFPHPEGDIERID